MLHIDDLTIVGWLQHARQVYAEKISDVNHPAYIACEMTKDYYEYIVGSIGRVVKYRGKFLRLEWEETGKTTADGDALGQLYLIKDVGTHLSDVLQKTHREGQQGRLRLTMEFDEGQLPEEYSPLGEEGRHGVSNILAFLYENFYQLPHERHGENYAQKIYRKAFYDQQKMNGQACVDAIERLDDAQVMLGQLLLDNLKVERI